MFENLKSEAKNSFKPLLNIVDVQSRTAHKMAREQLDFMGECLEVSARQAQTLRDERIGDALLRVPATAGRELSERWMNTAGRQWSILLEARDALSGEVQNVARNAESTVEKASESTEQAVKQASERAEKAAAKASDDADKGAAKATSSKSGGASARKNA